MQLADALREEHGFPLQSVYQDNGFVFCVKKADLEGVLPSRFINIVSKGAKFFFSSVELV
jgi:DNA mismatch repair protein MSH4